MKQSHILLLMTVMLLCTGCDSEVVSSTATPYFFTATLPPTSTPQERPSPTQPVSLPEIAEEANMPPIEGLTTTQVNVRAKPSTASASLGVIDIFVKTQIVGRDTSGSWYQVIYAESETGKGWVRAEYVQVDAGAEIRLVETAPDSGSGISGMIIQKVNVRNGPGVEFDLLGVLNSDDLVFITGRDAGGKWIQIEFAGASDGKGWVTAEFLQSVDIENAPLLGTTEEETPTPTVDLPTTNTAQTAAQDGDSMQSPLAMTVFSPTGSRAIEIDGDISAPNGDAEDWIQFTSQVNTISIQVTCTDTTLRAELWSNGKSVDDFPCGKISLVNVVPGSDYFLRLIQNGAGYTSYVLNLEVIP